MASKVSIGTIANVGFTALDVASNMSEGHGVISSVARAGLSFAINDIETAVLGTPIMLGLAAIQLGKIGADAAFAVGREKVQKVKHNTTGLGHVGGYFNDNQYGATMRQRSLTAIGGAQSQMRNALGNEARHRASTVAY